MGFKGLNVLTYVVKYFGITNINSVISAKDKNIEKDYFEEIKSFCELNNINFCNRTEKTISNSEFSIAISWRWLIFDKTNLIVLHDSLLPKYRGFNPLVTALISGDNQIGVTALYANEEFDTGDIIYQSKLNIKYPIKISSAIEKVTDCYIKVIDKIFQDIKLNKNLPRIAQNNKNASYSLWRDADDYKINWNESSSQIQRFVDSVGFPYKGAFSLLKSQRLRILETDLDNDLNIINRTPGKVLFIKDKIPYVVCGTGIIKLLKIVDESGGIFNLTSLRSRFY